MYAPGPMSFGDRLRRAMLQEWYSAPVMHLDKDENAYSSGQQDDNLYLIEEGRIKTVSYSRLGKQCLLSVFVERESFGELGIVSGVRAETATAMKPTVLRRMSAPRFMSALQQADLAEEFAMHLVVRLSEQQRVITNMVTMNCEQRLAAMLLELARKVGSRQGRELLIEERITHEDLAAMVGTTRSRVGLFLKRFRDKGLLVRGQDLSVAVNEWRMEQYVAAV